MFALLFDIIFIILIICNIIASFSKKSIISRVLYFLFVIGMIIIASSQTFNNDYNAYKYYYTVSNKGVLNGVETGFQLICKFSKDYLVLDYVSFRTLFFVLMFSVASFSIWKITERPNLIIVLYFIIFFAVNITQIRSGMCEAFILLSVYFLIRKKLIQFFLCVFLASAFHISGLFFGLFALLYFEKSKKWVLSNKNSIIISSSVLTIAFSLINSLIPAVARYINLFLGDDYRSAANFSEYAGNHFIKYLPVPIIALVLFYYLKNDKKYMILKNDKDNEKDMIIGDINSNDIMFELMTYISLIIYPLFTMNRQLSRISRTMVIISLFSFVTHMVRDKDNSLGFKFIFFVYLGYTYYCLSAYTSCLESLLRYSILSSLFY